MVKWAVFGGSNNFGVFTCKFKDVHGSGKYEITLDSSQDWTLEEAREAEGWTHLVVSRSFQPCDQHNDVPISKAVMKTIYDSFNIMTNSTTALIRTF